MPELEKKRFTQMEAIEVLVECAFLRDAVEVLVRKARDDLEYHQSKPQLRLVETE